MPVRNGSAGAIAGWVVAALALITSIVTVAMSAGSVQQRVVSLEKMRDEDSVKTNRLLESVARIEAQLQRLQLEADSKP